MEDHSSPVMSWWERQATIFLWEDRNQNAQLPEFNFNYKVQRGFSSCILNKAKKMAELWLAFVCRKKNILEKPGRSCKSRLRSSLATINLWAPIIVTNCLLNCYLHSENSWQRPEGQMFIYIKHLQACDVTAILNLLPMSKYTVMSPTGV